jgi:uncharacterized membrane protein
MESFIVATFKDMQHANEGLSKLKELDQLDEIVIYNMAMVRKKGDHLFEYLYYDGQDTQDLPAEGALIGSVIGLIAGPVGMAIGMMTGVMAGAIDEDDADDFTGEISDSVNNQLRTGEYAIIADVEEDIELLIDSYLGEYDATIVRTSLTDAFDHYDLEKWEELDKDIDDAQKELAAATEAQKSSLREKLAKLKAKREERNKKFRTRVENMRNKMQDKMKSLDQKIAVANGQRKEKLQAYNEKVRAKLGKWNENVNLLLTSKN